jgi:hypothetical protein
VLETLTHLQRLTQYGVGYRSFTEQSSGRGLKGVLEADHAWTVTPARLSD